MAHTGKWRRICRIQKSQECHNCSNKKKVIETKDKIVVVCDIGYGERTLEFSRHLTPYCGAYTRIPKEREDEERCRDTLTPIK